MTRPFAAAMLGLSVLAATSAARQTQQTPIFRTGVETVAIYATVVDSTGRLVPDLEQKDFEVLDNNKLQTLTLFKSDIQPITAVVILDTSGSMTMNLERLKNAAEAFVLRLLPDDKARIGNFDDKVVLSPFFTHDRDDLVRFIHEDMQYGNGTRLWDAVEQSMTALSREQGRRVVVVFTDGDDTTSTHASEDGIIKRAQAEDFMIYAIGFRSQILGTVTRPAKGLKTLADNTGGGYFELKDAADLNPTFTRVADELHRQYVLGFTPQTLDGKVHKLEVRVPGMTARARKTYTAPKGPGRTP